MFKTKGVLLGAFIIIMIIITIPIWAPSMILAFGWLFGYNIAKKLIDGEV